eukprot:symbB.v1.2.036293.t1/scaffold5091.1/size31067/1
MMQLKEELLPPWLKTDDLQVRTPMKLPRIPQAPPLPNTSWMLIIEERRRADEERLGPKADYPKPRTKLRGRSPKVPQTTEDWPREASTLDKRALARLLHDLKERLAREQQRTLAAKARVAEARQRKTAILQDKLQKGDKALSREGAFASAPALRTKKLEG